MGTEVGREGEAVALRYLKKKRYRILETNYRTPLGEIDIVARDGDTVVFVEVKTRSSLVFGHPFEAVTRQKRERMKRLALYYMKVNGLLDERGRFDVIALYLKDGAYRVQHFVDAFEV